MRCPVCNIELRMTERQGVEIDYCPQCRGIWLDRGELDKIIERTVSMEASAPMEEPEPPRSGGKKRKNDEPLGDHAPDERYEKYFRRKKHRKHDKYDDDDEGRRRRKKENPISDFFEEIFDF